MVFFEVWHCISKTSTMHLPLGFCFWGHTSWISSFGNAQAATGAGSASTLSSKTDIHPLICYFSVSDTAPETMSLAELTSPPSSLTSSFLKFKSHRDSELPAPTFSWVACCWDSFFQRTIRSLKSKNLEVCLCLMTQH